MDPLVANCDGITSREFIDDGSVNGTEVSSAISVSNDGQKTIIGICGSGPILGAGSGTGG
jgi:hypothetical protein